MAVAEFSNWKSAAGVFATYLFILLNTAIPDVHGELMKSFDLFRNVLQQ